VAEKSGRLGKMECGWRPPEDSGDKYTIRTQLLPEGLYGPWVRQSWQSSVSDVCAIRRTREMSIGEGGSNDGRRRGRYEKCWCFV
jgi:hypothetical protein